MAQPQKIVRRPEPTFTLGTTVELKDGSEPDVIVEYHYTPGTPDVFYLSNGDPGYPGDPEEIEILSIKEDKKGGKGRIIKDEEFEGKWRERLEELVSEQGSHLAEDEGGDY